ncbi:MAG: hypothetical protein JWM99_5246 [Verrucomicrobiales bacterium]|nr:hypothetical protein [Verrucomicrobiales bacterium]
MLGRFRLEPAKSVRSLSKGQRTQLGLIGAVCPEPELLILDEPTSGLDPIVRREFIQAVIGAYQEADPEHRTIFVSTHMITEFEGLIDEFTLIDAGREVLHLDADAARSRYRKIRARFKEKVPLITFPGAISSRTEGRELELIANGRSAEILETLKSLSPEQLTSESLTLEEIFIAALK